MDADNDDKKIDVLIVEDELDICYLLSGILKRRNLNISCVTSLLAAEQELYMVSPEILIIDNHLPDGLGVDFIVQVKKAYPLIKIIMITAHDTRDDRNKALTRGADFFIGKPFSSKTIIQTLDNLAKAI